MYQDEKLLNLLQENFMSDVSDVLEIDVNDIITPNGKSNDAYDEMIRKLSEDEYGYDISEDTLVVPRSYVDNKKIKDVDIHKIKDYALLVANPENGEGWDSVDFTIEEAEGIATIGGVVADITYNPRKRKPLKRPIIKY